MDSIGQFKTLQQLDISIQLDNNIAESTNFTFRIRNVALILLDNLETLISSTMFYIILINNPFLLYLADRDIFGAFFKNIINEIIQI